MTENKFISKELYGKVKKMSREELVVLLKKVRAAGKYDALKETKAIAVDLDKIRCELKGIKGLGEERAEIIIKILEENLSYRRTYRTKNDVTLDRETYRKLKSLSREKVYVLLNDFYLKGKKDALSAIKKVRIDIDKIRSDVSSVNGVGKVRLAQIMEMIERNIFNSGDVG